MLIRNKVAAFIITGGQDGIQAVAGQMMVFFSEIGYLRAAVPVHRALARLGVRGDGSQRGAASQNSEALRAGARELVARSAEMAKCLLEREMTHATIERGGRKASA